MPHSICSEISQTDKEGIIRLNTIKKESVSEFHDTLSFFVGILLITLARALMPRQTNSAAVLSTGGRLHPSPRDPQSSSSHFS